MVSIEARPALTCPNSQPFQLPWGAALLENAASSRVWCGSMASQDKTQPHSWILLWAVRGIRCPRAFVSLQSTLPHCKVWVSLAMGRDRNQVIPSLMACAVTHPCGCQREVCLNKSKALDCYKTGDVLGERACLWMTAEPSMAASVVELTWRFKHRQQSQL